MSDILDDLDHTKYGEGLTRAQVRLLTERVAQEIRRLRARIAELERESDEAEKGWGDSVELTKVLNKENHELNMRLLQVEQERPTLEEIIVIREAVRSLDRGHLYCRYCHAKSPDWRHTEHCPYARSVEIAEQARTILDRIQKVPADGRHAK